jgi:hypothetical protein
VSARTPAEAIASRCAAAHRDDPTPCEGPQDAVRIYDRWKSGGGVLGCVHHGARMLASVVGGLVYPGPSSDVGRRPGNDAAVDAYVRAQATRPFPWA